MDKLTLKVMGNQDQFLRLALSLVKRSSSMTKSMKNMRHQCTSLTTMTYISFGNQTMKTKIHIEQLHTRFIPINLISFIRHHTKILMILPLRSTMIKPHLKKEMTMMIQKSIRKRTKKMMTQRKRIACRHRSLSSVNWIRRGSLLFLTVTGAGRLIMHHWNRSSLWKWQWPRRRNQRRTCTRSWSLMTSSSISMRWWSFCNTRSTLTPTACVTKPEAVKRPLNWLSRIWRETTIRKRLIT